MAYRQVAPYLIRSPRSDLGSVIEYRVGNCPMSKTTSFVAALGAFGALAYLLNPLPPETQWANRVATNTSQVPPTSGVDRPPTPENPPSTAARPPAQDSAVRLVQQIQTELLRLGCYAGAVDGRWTPETQQAMHVLGERVRVLRPVETPDYIMLAFARSQSSHVCTARDRATAAARLPARMVPSAARGAAPVQPRADRAQTADAPRGRVTRRDESRTAPPGARTVERAAPALEDDDAVIPRDRDALGETRMGLGVASVDPLRSGMDPRDPSAPAILRGPGQPASPIGASVAELAPPPATRRAERDLRPAAPRGDWKRTIFSRMRENGP
jgi:hypothetical protein